MYFGNPVSVVESEVTFLGEFKEITLDQAKDIPWMSKNERHRINIQAVTGPTLTDR